MSAKSFSIAAIGLAAVSLLCVSAVCAQNPFWQAEDRPRPLAAREVTFPPYEVRTLGNGLQVLVVLHHEQPAVTMHLLVRAGAAQDPPQKEGVALLAAHLLDQGTTSRTATQIADQIDSIGGSLATSAQQDRTVASAVVMKDSFDVAMNLLADVIRNPAFDQGEIARQKEQALSLLQVNAEDPDYIASVVFDRLVYGQHPYGLSGNGTAETLAAISRADLQEFHRRYFVPNNMILAIVGDLTSDEAFSTAQRVFGAWPKAVVPAMTSPQPPPPAARIVVIDKPDAVQTEIRVGQLAIPRKHPDYLPWDLAVRILGGEGANRLHRILRSERGLTYGASADMDAKKLLGDFVAETDTRTETTGEALQLIRDEMVRLQQQRVSSRELSDAQAYLAGSFPLTIETPNDIAVQVLNAVFYELPLDEIGTFHTRVVSVTPDDVQRVARTYIRPAQLTIVLVGNARAFAPQLRSYGFPSFEVIPIAQLDLGSSTLRRDVRSVRAESPVRPPTLARGFRTVSFQAPTAGPQSSPVAPPASSRPAPAQGTTGTAPEGAAGELLRRVIEARGGLPALKAVRSVIAESDTTFIGERGELAAATKTKTYIVYPDKFRVDATVQGDLVSQVYNAGRAWEKGPDGSIRDLPAALRDDAAASVRRDAVPLLVGAAEGRLPVRALSEGALKVLEVTVAAGEVVRLYVDDSMLIVKQRFSVPGPNGRPIQQEESFSDYRPAGNLRVPFRAAVSRDGQTLVTRTVTKLTFNDPIDPALFERPAGASTGPARGRGRGAPPAGR